MKDVVIREATIADYNFILRLNEENVEVLSPMDESRLSMFVSIASFIWVVLVNDKTAAFMIALNEGAEGYDSENYLWFKQHYEHFLYIDRVVIDKPFRKMGLGKALYQMVFNYAKEQGFPLVTAEIDTVPYNESSLMFHKAMGFKEVGEQFVRGGQIKVSLQVVEIKDCGLWVVS